MNNLAQNENIMLTGKVEENSINYDYSNVAETIVNTASFFRSMFTSEAVEALSKLVGWVLTQRQEV